MKKTPTVQYLGNGVATDFAYLRANWDEDDIYVYLGDELQTEGYTIISEDLSEGAVIRFDVAPADGELITITRILVLERTTHFEESGVFKAEVMNDELDRLVAMIQQINETANRGLLLPITVSGANTQLPTPNPGKAIIWNPEGSGFQNSKDNFDDIIANNTLLANSVASNAAKALNSERAAAQSATAAENSKNEAAQIAIAFDNNAEEATEAFNANAAQKQANVDASVEEARTWAIGTEDERPEGSAKTWAGKAENIFNEMDVQSESVYQDVQKITTAVVNLQERICRYIKDVAQGDAFSIDASNLKQKNKNITFELILNMPTPVSFDFNSITTKWMGGEAPDLSEAGQHWFAFTSLDNGTTWIGSYEGRFAL